MNLERRIEQLEARLIRKSDRAEQEVDALCRRYLERKMPDYNPAVKTDDLIYQYFQRKEQQ